MTKVLASDLDGTLLNDKGKISVQNSQSIQKWCEQNIFVAASGRFFTNIQDLMKQNNIRGPIISLNGALILNDSGKVIFSNSIKNIELLNRYIKFCEKHHLIYTLYSTNGSYTRFYNEVTVWRLARARSKKEGLKLIESNFNFYMTEFYKKSSEIKNLSDMKDHLNEKILKVEVFSESIDMLRDFKLISSELNVTSSSVRNAEITAVGSTKGEALVNLLNYLNISKEKTYAIGDGENDISMFSVAGTSVVMANASDYIKQYNDFISVDNNNDGVAAAIGKFI